MAGGGGAIVHFDWALVIIDGMEHAVAPYPKLSDTRVCGILSVAYAVAATAFKHRRRRLQLACARN